MTLVPVSSSRNPAVMECCLLWGMQEAHGFVSDSAYENASEWLELVSNQSYFTTSIVFPWKDPAGPGVMLFASTPDSCRMDKENYFRDGKSEMSQYGWYQYDCYWYPGLAMHNVHDMIEHNHGGRFVGKLETVLDVQFGSRGITPAAWRQKYRTVPGQQYLSPLWNILHELHVPNWTMYTCGLSWEGYRAIDVYIKTMSYGMPAPEVEGWWIVNWEKVWWQRDLLQPYDWYQCRTWMAQGQKQSIYHWILKKFPAIKDIQMSRL